MKWDMLGVFWDALVNSFAKIFVLVQNRPLSWVKSKEIRPYKILAQQALDQTYCWCSTERIITVRAQWLLTTPIGLNALRPPFLFGGHVNVYVARKNPHKYNQSSYFTARYIVNSETVEQEMQTRCKKCATEDAPNGFSSLGKPKLFNGELFPCDSIIERGHWKNFAKKPLT